MKKPHKHAEVIKAWADGAEIQMKDKEEWIDIQPFSWHPENQYRVKPEPDMVFYGQIDTPAHGAFRLYTYFTREDNINAAVRLTYDGETGKLKSAEVL